MGIYVGDTEIKGIYLGDTSVKEVYLGTTKVRPSVIPITTAGIYHNATLGLISLSRDGLTRITYKDRNIGATTYDVTSTNSYGDYFSRGAKQNRNGQSASGYTMQEDWSLGNQTIAPSGFHIPTQAEWTSVVSILSSLGISPLNSNQARQYLLLPRSGQMVNNGTTIEYAETSGGGYYWSSTKATSTSAYILRSTSSQLNATGNAITFPRGFPIRLFKDTVVQPRIGGERDIIIQLKSYQDIKNMTYGTDVVAELNKYPLEYYNKLNSEGHMVKIREDEQIYWIVPNPSNPKVPDGWPISAEQPYNDSIWYDKERNNWLLGV